MKKFEPADIIIMILAMTVSIVLLISLLRPLFIDASMSAHGAEILKTILGSMISIISMYVGLKFKK